MHRRLPPRGVGKCWPRAPRRLVSNDGLVQLPGICPVARVWRQTRDPYRIWLSEIILQQTRVSQGLPYYERFVERLRSAGMACETGRFGARMAVELVNDGPVTFVLDEEP